MKVPTPRKLSSGTWFVQLRLDGQSISVTAPTKTECRTKAELIKAKYRNGQKDLKFRKVGEMTLREAVNQYIDSRKATLSPTTIRGYTLDLKHRFPKYMDKKIAAIKWQTMIDDELKNKSEKTVKNAWGLIRSSLSALDYPIPEVSLAKVPVNEIAFLQPEEIKPFCEALKGKSYEIPALLELHGLRLSEVLGLDWKNVDCKKWIITVNGARVRSLDGMVDKATNKNETSTRKVPIVIPQLRDAMKAVEDKTGPVANLGQLALLRDVKRTCKNAGVTVVTNHGLRHSFASLCYHQKISERQVMQWGGWADFQTMHRIYIRLAASDETEAAKNMESFFADSAEKPAESNTAEEKTGQSDQQPSA